MREGGSGAVTIMKFFIIEGCAVGFLIGLAVVAVISILGVDKGAGSVLSEGSFEDVCDVNLEGVSHG